MYNQTIVFLVWIILFLTGCAAAQKDKLLKNIITAAHKEHNISHGELLAKYNLLNISGVNSCLFAKDYGSIVNEAKHNNIFLQHMRAKLKKDNNLHRNALNKISIIHNNIRAISAKYNIISSADLRKLGFLDKKSGKDKSSAFASLDSDIHHKNLYDLAAADYIIRYVPIFLPQNKTLLTSGFGARKCPMTKTQKSHSGIDLAGPKNSNIYSSADGRVVEVAASKSYGKYIIIDHGNIFKTRYAHLSKLRVSEGDAVFRGQILGHQGSTGHSTAPHLHFEVIYKNHLVDPFIFIGSEYKCRQKG